MLECLASLGGQRQVTHFKRFLIPADEYRPGPFGFVIDENRHAVSDRADRLHPERWRSNSRRNSMSSVPAPIYPQLEEVALPHLVDYVTDLTVHDAKICRVLDPGDAAMYAIRSSGTHFCTYRNVCDRDTAQAASTARRGLDYVDAVHFVARDARWYRIECTAPGIGTVTPIAFADARAIVRAECDRQSGNAIS